jgi:hypothetical protein
MKNMTLSYTQTPHYIYDKLGQEKWFTAVNIYCYERYHAIEERLIQSFRYVQCVPENAGTFSYEFASIVRDVGSVFGSCMDKIVRENNQESKKQYDICDYRKWLVDNVPNVHLLSVQMNVNRTNRFLAPFSMFNNAKAKISWWFAHTNLKHSDIDHFVDGNLAFAVFGLSALATLFVLGYPYGRVLPEMQFFTNVGVREPIEELKQSLFLTQREDVEF